jgi:hypothetical protein
MPRYDALPVSLPTRGLSRDAASGVIGKISFWHCMTPTELRLSKIYKVNQTTAFKDLSIINKMHTRVIYAYSLRDSKDE